MPKLKWEGGRLILEVEALIRIPVTFDAIAKVSLPKGTLTMREQQALDGVLRGWSNKDIAEAMHLSERTVKFHVSQLLRKFTAQTRGELAALFSRTPQGDKPDG